MKSILGKFPFLLLLAVLLTGCGIQRGDEEIMSQDFVGASSSGGSMAADENVNNEDPQSKESERANYADTHISLGKRYDVVTVLDLKVYGCYVEEGEIFLACQDKSDGEIEREVKLPLSSETGYVQNLSVNANGEVFVFACNYQENEHYCWKIGLDDTVTEVEDFTLEDIDTAELITLKNIRSDDTGRTYLWYEMAVPLTEVEENVPEEDGDVYSMINRVYVKDSQLNSLFYVQLKELVGMEVTKDGQPTVFFNEEGNIYAQPIDMTAKKLGGEAIRLTDESQNYSEYPQQFAVMEEGFLFCQEGYLYEYRYDTGLCEKLLTLSSYGILPGNILSLKAEEGIIEIVDNYPGEDCSELVSLREGTGEKTVVTLGLMMASRELEEAVAGFNRTSSSVRVELMSYYNSAEGYDKGLEQLKLDIIRGKAPDIIEVSSIDCSPLADKGIFADLYGFMEGDVQCNPEIIVPSIRKVYEKDGHLYSIAPSFLLHSMWGKTDVVGTETGLTLSELIELLQSKGKTLDAINGFSADEPVLTTLCTFGMHEFIDWENGTCDFTGEYFKEILEFAKQYEGSYSEGTLSQGIAQKEILLTLGLITSVSDYQIQKELYGGKLTFVGYPVSEGSGTAISFRGDELAINAASENQDAAWEFVRYFFLNGYDGAGFPVHAGQLEEVMEDAMVDTIVSDMDGEGIMVKASYRDEDIYINVFAAEKEDVDSVMRLIESADRSFQYNTDVMNIINEEAQAYFDGQKSAEDVAKIIQSRVKLYVQEQMD